MRSVIRSLFIFVLLGLATNASAEAEWWDGADTGDLKNSLEAVGIFDKGNDNGAHNIFLEVDHFQAAFGTGWSPLAKVEDPSWGIGSLGLTLPTGQGSTSGTWQVDPTAWNGYEQGEILAVLKAGNKAAAYELDLFDESNSNSPLTSGSWNVSSEAWKKSNGQWSGLSHFSLFAKEGFPPQNVPVPGAMFLGCLGLGFAAHRLKRGRS